MNLLEIIGAVALFLVVGIAVLAAAGVVDVDFTIDKDWK
jgi:hypothetical protein